jgi:outer membrane protein assembly factor BamB
VPFNLGLAALPGGDVIQATMSVSRRDVRRATTRWTFAPGGMRLGTGSTNPEVAVSATTAFVAGQGVLFAIDLETGSLRWQAEIGEKIAGGFLGRPTVVPGGGRRRERVATTDLAGVVHVLDAETGDTVATNPSMAENRRVLLTYEPGPVTISRTGKTIQGALFAVGAYGSSTTASVSQAAFDLDRFESAWSLPTDGTDLVSAATIGKDSHYVVRRDSAGRQQLERRPLDALSIVTDRTTAIEPFVPLVGGQLLRVTPVELALRDGEVYFATVSGLGIVRDDGAVETVDLEAEGGFVGPMVYQLPNGSERLLLAGSLPPDQRVFFIIFALPLSETPLFLQVDLFDPVKVGPLVVSESLFAVTYLQGSVKAFSKGDIRRLVAKLAGRDLTAV